MEPDSYSPTEAARVLGVSDRRVRQLLEAGDLEGGQDDSGRWRTPQRAVHAMLEERGSPRGPTRRAATPDGHDAGDVAGAKRRPARGPEDAFESVRDLVSRVEDLSYRLGASQARLELTENAESTLREERDRLARELEDERAERRRLAERLERVEGGEATPDAPADAPVSETSGDPAPTPPDYRPWWKRIFR